MTIGESEKVIAARQVPASVRVDRQAITATSAAENALSRHEKARAEASDRPKASRQTVSTTKNSGGHPAVWRPGPDGPAGVLHGEQQRSAETGMDVTVGQQHPVPGNPVIVGVEQKALPADQHEEQESSRGRAEEQGEQHVNAAACWG